MTSPRVPSAWVTLANAPADIVATVCAARRRVLLSGSPGAGKSTLAAALARELARLGRACECIGADPGSPGFGVPGTVARATWRDDAWQVDALEALCTLDAGRFRAPLIAAVRRMARDAPRDVLLLDGPGVVRGVAGSELLLGLVDAGEVDAVLVLTDAERAPPLVNELRSLALPIFVAHAHPAARRPGDAPRARTRTARWDAYLAASEARRFDLDAVQVIGTPPPRGVATAWVGRQIGFLEHGRTLALGEVVRVAANELIARAPAGANRATALLVRDAQRGAAGLLQTAVPFAAERLDYVAATRGPGAAEGGPRVVGRVGSLNLRLLNGVFGDPLLHAQPQFSARGLLFDLGSGERLSARIAHQVSDVFITHAHLDHIGGFVWLLRSRIGEFPPCRIYGPPGTAGHIAGFLEAILWDRAGDRAPRFEVFELHGDVLHRYALDARHPRLAAVDKRAAPAGVVLREAGYCVRATTLDHGTPVLAYAYEPEQQLNIRKDRLLARGFAPGPWLGTLKERVLAGDGAARIALPNGQETTVDEAAEELVLATPGKRLVYATDFADTADNRERVIAFARFAHTLFCEATFVEADRDQARRTGHLTTRACGEIANAAHVARLVPFHFSRRYAHDAQRVYAEIAAVCSATCVPRAMTGEVAECDLAD